nr:protein kinase [Nannocystis sp. ILAH1]
MSRRTGSATSGPRAHVSRDRSPPRTSAPGSCAGGRVRTRVSAPDGGRAGFVGGRHASRVRDLGSFGSTIDPDSEASDRLSTDAPDGEGQAVAGDAASQKFGRFRLLHLLGQLDRVVALKMVRGDRNTAVIGRLIREAKALGKLSHPDVVQIFDVSTLRGAVFLTTEYVRGRTLREEMAGRRREGGFEASVDLFLQAGRGPAAVHAAGLVHRDFKPDNGMVGDDGRVRVMDFEWARATGAPVPVPVAADEPRGEVERTALAWTRLVPA